MEFTGNSDLFWKEIIVSFSLNSDGRNPYQYWTVLRASYWQSGLLDRNEYHGHTCSVVRRTKLLVRPYLLPLKMDHPGVVLVTGDSGGPSHQYGLSRQWCFISFNGKRYRRTTEQVRPTKTWYNEMRYDVQYSDYLFDKLSHFKAWGFLINETQPILKPEFFIYVLLS